MWIKPQDPVTFLALTFRSAVELKLDITRIHFKYLRESRGRLTHSFSVNPKKLSCIDFRDCKMYRLHLRNDLYREHCNLTILMRSQQRARCWWGATLGIETCEPVVSMQTNLTSCFLIAFCYRVHICYGEKEVRCLLSVKPVEGVHWKWQYFKITFLVSHETSGR